MVNGGPNILSAGTCVKNEDLWGEVEGHFASLFVGVPFTTVPINQIVSRSLSNVTGIAKEDLGVNASQAICYITGVKGGFRHSYVEVGVSTAVNPLGEWEMQIAQGSGNQIGGSVACMPYVTNH